MKKNIKVEIILGNPKIACKKFGVCNILNSSKIKKMEHPIPRQSSGILRLNQNSMVIFFEIASMTLQTQKYYFANLNNEFRLDHDLEATNYGIFSKHQNFTVKAGIYPVLKKGKYYKVTFSMEVSKLAVPEVVYFGLARMSKAS